MAIQWSAIESALQAWLVASSGVIASQVIFRHQKTPSYQPASGTPAFFTLVLDGPTPLGSQDEIRFPYDGTKPLGQEIQTTIVGQREFSVSVQAYTIQEVGAGSAKELLGTARTYLSLPSQQDAFAAAGTCFIDATKIDNLPVLGDMGQGRAHMAVRFRAVDSVIGPTGYIATVGPDVPSGAANPAGTLS